MVRGTAALPLIASGPFLMFLSRGASADSLLFFDHYQAVYNPHAVIPDQMKIDSQLGDYSSENGYELVMV